MRWSGGRGRLTCDGCAQLFASRSPAAVLKASAGVLVFSVHASCVALPNVRSQPGKPARRDLGLLRNSRTFSSARGSTVADGPHSASGSPSPIEIKTRRERPIARRAVTSARNCANQSASHKNTVGNLMNYKLSLRMRRIKIDRLCCCLTYLD